MNTSNRMVLALCLAALPRVAGGAHATIIDLGSAPQGQAGSYAEGYALNQSGTVVGEYTGPGSSQRHFIWSSGVFADVGLVAQGINSQGTVAGTHAGQAYIRDSGGALSPLGAFGAFPFSGAKDINDAGIVVGLAASADGNSSQAIKWQGGVPTPLPHLPGGGSSAAHAINSAGVVVGESYTFSAEAGRVVKHAAMWDPSGSATDLGSLGGDQAEALDINDTGVVVGWQNGETLHGGNDYPRQGFLWQNGQMIQLPGVYEAYAINNRNQIVGWSHDSRAVLWDDGLLFDLTELLAPASGWNYLQRGRDINDAGQVTGYGFTETGDLHAFLLTLPNLSGRWIATGGGVYTDGQNWKDGQVPTGSDRRAFFLNSTSGPSTVTFAEPLTLGAIRFDHSSRYTLAGPATLTLAAPASAPAKVEVLSGNHTISAPLQLESNTEISVSQQSSRLTVAVVLAAYCAELAAAS